jgi:hypothetical protein
MSYRRKARTHGDRTYVWERYVCSTRERDCTRCDQSPLPRDVVERAVLDALRERGGSVQGRAQAILDALESDRAVTAARLAEAERELTRLAGQRERVESDYLGERLSAESYERFRSRLETETQAAQAEADRLAQREAELAAQLSTGQVQEAVLAAMAELRAAVSAAVAGAERIERVRAVLRTVFPVITVRRVGEDYHLDPGEPGDLSLLLERDPSGSPTMKELDLPCPYGEKRQWVHVRSFSTSAFVHTTAKTSVSEEKRCTRTVRPASNASSCWCGSRAPVRGEAE